MSELRLRDDKVIAYDDLGTGEPLLLIHGFTGSRRAWRKDLIAELSTHYRVIVPDLIGHGQSQAEHAPARFALHEVVTDLCELLTACRVSRATWIGYSMGGRIALGAAALEPTRVKALVLEGASPGLSDTDARTTRRTADDELARALETEGIERFVDRWMSQPLFATQRRLPPECLREQRNLRLANDARSLAACLRGLGTGSQPSFWKQLGTIEAPALLIAGAQDAKFVTIAHEMQKALPDARVVEISDAGHTTSLEQPASYLAAIHPFVTDPRARRRAE